MPTDKIDRVQSDAALTDRAPEGRAPSPAAVPFWAALIDDTPQPAVTPQGRDRPACATVTEPMTLPPPVGTPAVASVDVVFADLTEAGGVDGRLGMIAARALRRGGILAVLTRCHHPEPGGALFDPTGAIVASAQNADLLYLQHIVIPTGLLRPPPPAHLDAAQPDLDQPGEHVIAHVDLVVFGQPRNREAHPGLAAEPAPEAAAAEPAGGPR